MVRRRVTPQGWHHDGNHWASSGRPLRSIPAFTDNKVNFSSGRPPPLPRLTLTPSSAAASLAPLSRAETRQQGLQSSKYLCPPPARHPPPGSPPHTPARSCRARAAGGLGPQICPPSLHPRHWKVSPQNTWLPMCVYALTCVMLVTVK
jgi:hypothetical protein